jgi:hypothetical protein
LVEDQQTESFYDAAPLEPHLLYQGEIIIDQPVLYPIKASRWLMVRTYKGGSVLEAIQNGQTPTGLKVWDSNKVDLLWDEHKLGDFALGQLQKVPALVLSQTCDIGTKDSIQIAPIFPAPQDDSYVGKLLRLDIFSAFPIPPHPPEIETNSFADLEQIQSVPKSYLKRIKPEHHFRLRPENILNLQRHITRFFGRPNSFDAGADKVPREGKYLCIRCVYSNGIISSIELKEKADFPRCSKCGGPQWIFTAGK